MGSWIHSKYFNLALVTAGLTLMVAGFLFLLGPGIIVVALNNTPLRVQLELGGYEITFGGWSELSAEYCDSPCIGLVVGFSIGALAALLAIVSLFLRIFKGPRYLKIAMELSSGILAFVSAVFYAYCLLIFGAYDVVFGLLASYSQGWGAWLMSMSMVLGCLSLLSSAIISLSV